MMSQEPAEGEPRPVPPLQPKTDDRAVERNPLQYHVGLLLFIYASCAVLSAAVLSAHDARLNVVTLLSTGAILATFGAAIGSLGAVWERDLLERVQLNIDILYQDIIEQSEQWRRWPFLPRFRLRKMLDATKHQITLQNPTLPLDVGTHIIRPHVPTVLEDFFDLPLWANVYPLIRYRRAAQTLMGRRKKDLVSDQTGLTASAEHMAYECLHDTWLSILKFRVARYVIHFGAALTIFGSLFTGFAFVWITEHASWLVPPASERKVIYEFRLDSAPNGFAMPEIRSSR